MWLTGVSTEGRVMRIDAICEAICKALAHGISGDVGYVYDEAERGMCGAATEEKREVPPLLKTTAGSCCHNPTVRKRRIAIIFSVYFIFLLSIRFLTVFLYSFKNFLQKIRI